MKKACNTVLWSFKHKKQLSLMSWVLNLSRISFGRYSQVGIGKNDIKGVVDGHTAGGSGGV